MTMKNKRGQITIFIIIGILIVSAVLVFLFATDTGKKFVATLGFSGDIDAENYLKKCISEDEGMKEKIDLIASQGGVLKPENYFSYQGKKYEYLCYSNEYYKTCVMQNPFPLNIMEDEVKKIILEKSEECIRNLKKNLENKGYKVSSGKSEINTELNFDNIATNIKIDLSVSKGDETRKYSEFNILRPSHYYQLIMLSTSILNYEARYGDSNVDTYMALYPEIKIQKLKQSDGATLYFVSDRDTKETFSFAVRSIAWPPGYG